MGEYKLKEKTSAWGLQIYKESLSVGVTVLKRKLLCVGLLAERIFEL